MSRASSGKSRALQELLERGSALCQQGKLVEAEKIYEEILRRRPRDFDAPHLLRIIALRVEKWKNRLGNDGFKIGIAGHGDKLETGDGNSFSLSEFYNISKIPNVRLINLQNDQESEQLAQFAEGMGVETLGRDFDAEPKAFLDTAAVIKNLDLVITTDSFVAHLAGVLGRPAWVVLEQVPDWDWLLEKSVSPWYPTLRLFRKKSGDDWEGIFGEIEKELRSVIGSNAGSVKWKIRSPQTPTVQVSWGEVIDRITILEIKREKINSDSAVANVLKELSLLLKLTAEHIFEIDSIEHLRIALKSVNEALWNVEDRLRLKEKDNIFDQDFIELARSVYILNDKRAALKKSINIELSSEIIEEKCYQDY